MNNNTSKLVKKKEVSYTWCDFCEKHCKEGTKKINSKGAKFGDYEFAHSQLMQAKEIALKELDDRYRMQMFMYGSIALYGLALLIILLVWLNE